ncbi:MAG: TM0106 family RecB-like putative nuclease [Candidatus Acidiferrales bacterium]
MELLAQHLRLAATDLSNHLACHHVTTLDLSVARGERTAPKWEAPDLAVIQELGTRHEAAYLNHLRDQGLSFVNLAEIRDEQRSIAETLSCMERGVDVIAQGTLAHDRWFGRPDVLRKVTTQPSRFGDWSYEVYDCKLTRETKAASLLQLALYSEMLAKAQNAEPEVMHVVPGGANFQPEPYRCDEFAAYYRYVKAQLEDVSDNGKVGLTYPEPCAHCDVCRWFRECDARRRGDDHLSLVAGINKLQRTQLNEWQTETMARLAVLPIPLDRKPRRGSKEAIERVREQARVQVEARTLDKLVHELLDVDENSGLCKLPAPSPRDMFVDLEGDPFAGDSGQEYLFGFVAQDDGGKLHYQKQWCLTPDEEKRAFEWLIDEVMKRWSADPAMHLYHFGGYERTHLRNLTLRYVTREAEIDRMLRAHVFVDLHTIFKQAVRAGVEEYSLKKLEAFHKFERTVPLEQSRAAMRHIEHWLELERGGELRKEDQNVMEGYNEDDCRSTASLRDWLEIQRQNLERTGEIIPRPLIEDGAPSEQVDERQKRVAALVAQLIEGLPASPSERSSEQSARWMLAQLLDWHRREDKVEQWQYFHFAEMDDDSLMEERPTLGGLQLVWRSAKGRTLPVDTYSFPPQETDVHAGDKVCHRDVTIGKVESIDFAKLTVDIKKTGAALDLHPPVIFVDRRGNQSYKVLAESLFALGEWVRDRGFDAPEKFRAVSDLLLRRPPRLTGNQSVAALPGEDALANAWRVVRALDNSVFAIQGPPGAGKTYTAARMICRLVAEGKKVGVTALGHKVIRKVLEEVQAAADELHTTVQCVQKVKGDGPSPDPLPNVEFTTKNEIPLARLQSGRVRVVAGTAWLWARPEYFEQVDVLFIDEAGQMALADVAALAQGAKNLVLVGDPQQLERPLKGSHPEGADESALQYILGKHKTIQKDMGLLLPETWRMHPKICDFTSEMFYERRLGARSHTRSHLLEGHPWLKGAGLWFVPVAHEGNRNSSAEEVEVVARIVDGLLVPGVKWFYGEGNSRPLRLEDILVVAPYNAQVSDLLACLPNAKIGTVDRFQGQEAPVVIYSLTTSSPEDAPRGMEFLFSLNRLNVATSRGQTAVIIVGSPRLFEPECKTPRQMQLANAFCRYLEMATPHTGLWPCSVQRK